MYEKIHGARDERKRGTFMPELAQEEFDVWAWETVHGRKAQCSIFNDHWAADLPACTHGSDIISARGSNLAPGN